MAYVICDKHGGQGADLATRSAIDLIMSREKSKERLIALDMFYEDLEIGRYIVDSDKKILINMGGEFRKDNEVYFSDGDAFDEALSLFYPVCVKCIHESPNFHGNDEM